MDMTNRGVPGRVGARAAPNRETNVIVAADASASRDRVHWGPIWAGLVTALTVFLLLQMVLYWAGSFVDVENANVVATDGWLSIVVALGAFFLGGWVAATGTDTRGAGAGVLNGFLVWALGIVLILAFSALGIGQVFGVAGSAFSRFLTTDGMMTGMGSMPMPNVDPMNVVSTTREAAGWGALFLSLAALAAMIGGYVGDKSGPIEVATNTAEPDAPTT